jgi:hypothetical protein
MSDNIAILEGFTTEIMCETEDGVLFLLVKPNTNFAGIYRAWDTDSQKFITLGGKCARWNMCYAERIN